MDTQSTISTKFQVVIPKKIRSKLNLKPNDKIMFQFIDDETLVINKTPEKIQDLKGSFKFPKNYLKNERASW
jgi:AbrB family looped-hinge helix DNA binding protein